MIWIKVCCVRVIYFRDHISTSFDANLGFYIDAGSVERSETGVQKENKAKSTKASSQVVGNSKTVKKQERKTSSLISSEVDKASYQGSPRNSRETNGRSRVKGRVKEFVKMFNQETPSKPKDRPSFRSRSCKWDEKRVFEEETTISTTRTDEKLQVPEVSRIVWCSTNMISSLPRLAF